MLNNQLLLIIIVNTGVLKLSKYGIIYLYFHQLLVRKTTFSNFSKKNKFIIQTPPELRLSSSSLLLDDDKQMFSIIIFYYFDLQIKHEAFKIHDSIHNGNLPLCFRVYSFKTISFILSDD